MLHGVRMKRLLLMRHAKSDWNTAAPSDFERPLAARGLRDAPKMARWLRDQGLRPELIVTSPAVRAHQTAAHICEGLNMRTTDLLLEPRLYGADVADLIAIIGNFPSHMNLCMLIGHNPGLEDLIGYLASAVQAAPDHDKVMPTAGVYLLALGDSWVNLQPGCGQVVDSMRPKSL